MTRILLPFFLCIFLFSCTQKGTIFEEHKKLPENLEWKSSESQKITIPVKDNSKPVRFVLAFRYATGFQFDHMQMRIKETDPEGNNVIRDVQFKVRNENGEFIGDAGYDIIDLEYVLDEEKQFPVLGEYTYEIVHSMPVDPIFFAMEVGLIVKEIENLQ